MHYTSKALRGLLRAITISHPFFQPQQKLAFLVWDRELEETSGEGE